MKHLISLILFSSVLCLSGCEKLNDGTINVNPEIPNVDRYAKSAKLLAMLTVQYAPSEDIVKVSAIMKDIINIVKKADGQISGLIISTAKQAVSSGYLPEKYFVFIQAVVVLIDGYVNTVSFNIDDIIKILDATLDGLNTIRASSTTESLTNW